MNKYDARIYANGRFALILEEDFSEAIEQGKEILVFCGGWSGGYARIHGADRVPDYYDLNGGKDCFDLYSHDVKDKTFTPEEMSRFYRVIVTDGVKVYMKTGEPATQYFGSSFSDWDTKFEDYKRKFGADKNATIEEFEKMRHEIDIEKTLNMVYGNTQEEKEEIQKAIKGYLH